MGVPYNVRIYYAIFSMSGLLDLINILVFVEVCLYKTEIILPEFKFIFRMNHHQTKTKLIPATTDLPFIISFLLDTYPGVLT